MTHDAPDLSTQNRIHADAPNSYLPEVIAFAALSFYVVVDTQIERTLRFRMFNRRNEKNCLSRRFNVLDTMSRGFGHRNSF